MQDGSGNSTSTTNAIQGSAKAWGSFNGNGGVTTNASYNTSSITRSSGGTYVVTFTSALSDANYSVVCTTGTLTNSTKALTPYTPLTTGFSIQTLNTSWAAQDSYWVSYAVFR